MTILSAIVLGGLFGFALYQSGASNPKKLLAALRLEDLSLMKTILFGIGFASILLSLSSLVGLFDLSHLSIKTTHLGVVAGGLIFGIGFGAAGTCPGTCVAASGSDGIKKAITAVIGGLLGAFVFSLSYGWFQSLGLFDVMNLGKLTLFNISDKFPSVINLGFGGLLIMGAFLAAIAYIMPARLGKTTQVKQSSYKDPLQQKT
ncbi:MAG: DUF6691 family protein [Caldicoprobacterales bacterium]|jgi:uncharacterized membrane protein YedE/YeeE|nr:YeeE/YedE family protein [Clostridiales bacterium]